MSDNGPFKIEKDGYITWLTFNRAEKRNTMTIDFFEGLSRYFQEFDEDPDVRVVIIKVGQKKTVCLLYWQNLASVGN